MMQHTPQAGSGRGIAGRGLAHRGSGGTTAAGIPTSEKFTTGEAQHAVGGFREHTVEYQRVAVYSGSLGSMGECPGKLVREGPGPNKVFLVMEGGMVHALWPATEDTRHVLRAADSNGADVTVNGKYYPSIGVIVVTRVAAAK